jgi:hypothetical protein
MPDFVPRGIGPDTVSNANNSDRGATCGYSNFNAVESGVRQREISVKPGTWLGHDQRKPHETGNPVKCTAILEDAKQEEYLSLGSHRDGCRLVITSSKVYGQGGWKVEIKPESKR